MIKKVFVTSFVLILGFTISSCSHFGKYQHKKYAKEMFKKMDSNNDGFITKYEERKFSAAKFKEMDVDGNGRICLKEFLGEMKRDGK